MPRLQLIAIVSILHIVNSCNIQINASAQSAVYHFTAISYQQEKLYAFFIAKADSHCIRTGQLISRLKKW